MNFNQIAMLQKLKSSMDRFRNNHPKFPLFLKAVVGNALEEGTLVEINVTTPEGKNYCTNLKLKQEDLEFFQTLSEMGSLHKCQLPIFFISYIRHETPSSSR